jgi:hypothetical protein
MPKPTWGVGRPSHCPGIAGTEPTEAGKLPTWFCDAAGRQMPWQMIDSLP